MQTETFKNTKNRFRISGFVLALLLVVGISGTVAWFASSEATDVDGLEMVSSTGTYDISSVDGGKNGIYHDYYSAIVTDPEADVLVWQMTDDSNMENYSDTDDGIAPGSSGKLSFKVTPRIDEVHLLFDFEIVGYVSTVGGAENKVITMSEIDKDSLKNYLNGHILLFSGYKDGKYSGLIASDEDMHRVFDKSFTGKNTPTTVDIYWVWPEHFSNLVNAYGDTVTEQTFLDATSDDYTAMVEHIRSFPQYYLKGDKTDTALAALLEDKNTNASIETTETKIKSSYDTYGGPYDEADNDIGTGVEFILVRMMVSEWE